jgi:hypothetical protein
MTTTEGDEQMASFIIRKIDPELWERVKAQATKEGRPLRWLLLRLLELYATVGLAVLEGRAAKK